MLLSNDVIIWFDVMVLLTSLLLVLAYGKSKELKLTYSLFVYGLIFWLVTLLIYYSDMGINNLLFIGRSNFVSIKITTLAYYLFIRVFIKNGSKINRKDFVWMAVNVVVIALTLFSPLMISKEIALPNNYRETEFGLLYPIYIANMLLDIVFAVSYAIKNYKKSSQKERKQIKIFLSFTVLSMILGGSTNLILPQLGIFNYQMYGTFALTLLNLAIVYLIVRLQFLNVKIILGRIIYYLILIILVVILYYSVIYLDKKILPNYEENPLIHVFTTIVIGLLFILFFNKTNEILKKQVRTRFINPGYDPYEILEEFNRNISRLVTEEDLSKELSNVILRTLRPSKVEVVFNGKNDGIYSLMKSFWEKTKNNHIIYEHVVEKIEENKKTVKEEAITSQLLSNMKKSKLSSIFFITDQDRYFGALLMSTRDSDVDYSMYNIEFVDNLTKIVGLATLRSVLYEELEQFNQTLQQKVNEQTQELQVKVQQLQEARRKERDMIDIMGHELRTPATVVKLNAELLEKFTDDVINNKEKFELYVKRIKTAVDNEIKLINTLLSSAKLEGDKIELNLEEVDVLVDIDMAIHGHMQLAEDKGLNLVNNSDQSTPTIFADHARVIEILNNLVDNAIKYTEKGNVIISTSYTDDMITISVEDTGKGISKDEIPNLGQKFYRIGNYLDNGEGKPDLVRPGGTGLGLYVAFSLIEKMGGKMDIRSEPGKGSKFSFTLPKYKGQDTNFSKRDSKDMFERLGLKHTNL